MTTRATEPGHGAPTMAALRARKEEILEAAAAYGASGVRIFGSVARGTATAASDIDVLVDFERGRTLLDQVGLWKALERIFGRSVDLVSAGGLTERDDDIRADALPL